MFWLYSIAVSGLGRAALSHQGDRFCFAFIRNSGGTAGSLELSLHVTSAESVPVNFTVAIGNRRDRFGILFETRGVASPGAFTPVVIPTAAEVVRGEFMRKGVEISTDGGGKISVIASSISNSSSDAFLVHPLRSYVGVSTYNYYVLSTANSDSNTNDSVFVVASCDDRVQIQLRLPTDLSERVNIPPLYTLSGLPERPRAGEPFSLHPLVRADTVHIWEPAEDLSGVMITTTGPVAVMAGHTCGEVLPGAPGCSHIAEQIPPTLSWGYTFLTAPLARRLGGEFYKIIASAASNVTITCAPPGGGTSNTTHRQVYLQEGVVHEINTTSPQYCCIQSNRPIIVMQYAYGHSVDRTILSKRIVILETHLC